MAYTLYIVGIGPGNPDYVVPKGLNLLLTLLRLCPVLVL